MLKIVNLLNNFLVWRRIKNIQLEKVSSGYKPYEPSNNRLDLNDTSYSLRIQTEDGCVFKINFHNTEWRKALDGEILSTPTPIYFHDVLEKVRGEFIMGCGSISSLKPVLKYGVAPYHSLTVTTINGETTLLEIHNCLCCNFEIDDVSFNKVLQEKHNPPNLNLYQQLGVEYNHYDFLGNSTLWLDNTVVLISVKKYDTLKGRLLLEVNSVNKQPINKPLLNLSNAPQVILENLNKSLLTNPLPKARSEFKEVIIMENDFIKQGSLTVFSKTTTGDLVTHKIYDNESFEQTKEI